MKYSVLRDKLLEEKHLPKIDLDLLGAALDAKLKKETPVTLNAFLNNERRKEQMARAGYA